MNLLRALQSYSSFRNTASGAVMEQCSCASTHHLASSIHPTVWELQHGTGSSVSSRNYWKEFVFYVNAHETSYTCVHRMATLLFTAVGIACLADSCYYSLAGGSPVHGCFRPIKKDIDFLFLYPTSAFL